MLAVVTFQSRRLFDDRIALSWPGDRAGTPWPGSIGFRWTGWRAGGGTKSTKPPPHACWGELGRIERTLRAVVSRRRGHGRGGAGSVRRQRHIPAVGLLGCAQRRCRPSERVLREPEGVLDVESTQVGPEAQLEVGLTAASPPQPQRLFGPAVGSGEVFNVDTQHTAFDDRGKSSLAQRPRPIKFGCTPCAPSRCRRGDRWCQARHRGGPSCGPRRVSGACRGAGGDRARCVRGSGDHGRRPRSPRMRTTTWARVSWEPAVRAMGS